MKTGPDYSVVIPLYNEEENVPELLRRLSRMVEEIPYGIELVFVDDGSGDHTVEELRKGFGNMNAKIVVLSRNFGHQTAVSAGLEHALGARGALIIDGDLQDPPELLLPMIDKMNEGYDVVYAVRRNRKEGIGKRVLYFIYYRILKTMSETMIPVDSGDFALMSRRVVDLLNSMPEESRFLRGMRAWVGFRQAGYEYDREERAYGKSKYTIRRLFKLAYDGIFNFSTAPVRLIRILGGVSMVGAGLYLLSVLLKKLIYGTVPEGFTALFAAIVLFSGTILFSLSVLGEYIIRIFFEVKGRPKYIVSELYESKTHV